MKKMSLSEIQATNVETLFRFADYCNDKGLRYYLAYGTLLGAVRHQGIIPWDDDIDVWMPRADYELFSKSFNSDAGDEPYRFYNMDNDEWQYDYRGIVADVRTLHSYGRRVTDFRYGLHIDVFPLDFQDNNERARKRMANRSYRLLDLAHRLVLADRDAYLSSHSFVHNIVYRAARRLAHHVDIRRLLRNEDAKARSHPESEWIGIVGDNAIAGYRAEWFSDTVELQFNGRKLLAPIGYEEILQTQYGDYMRLPPEEDRHPYGTGYWRD